MLITTTVRDLKYSHLNQLESYDVEWIEIFETTIIIM
jgi:hypothetical protein